MNIIKKYDKDNRIIYYLNNSLKISIFYKYHHDEQTEKILIGNDQNFSYIKYKGNKIKESYEITNHYYVFFKEINPNFFKTIKYNRKHMTFNKKITYQPEDNIFLTKEKYLNRNKNIEENFEFTLKNINNYGR